MSLFKLQESRCLLKFFFGVFWVLTNLSRQNAYAEAALPATSYKIATVDAPKWSDERKKEEVRSEIDRIASQGFNVISLGTYKFMPMYFVDYSTTKYPDAQQISLDRVKKNVSTIRDNMRYAKQKGIEYIVSRSYSHYIPYQLWKSRQNVFNPGNIYTRYLDNAHQNDLYKSALAGKGDVIGHQQWTNPVYKDFFISSTVQMLQVLPELDGFLNAYAEAAWTLDEQKLKEDQWKVWKENIKYDETNANFIDYVNHLHRILAEARGKKAFLGIRDWYVDAKILEKLDFPLDEFFIAVKYGGFDQPVANYGPWGDTLKSKGIRVIQDMLVFDAEHPHPLYWYDSDFITRMIQNVIHSGFGIQYQDFQIKGDDKADNPIRLLAQETVGKALKNEKFERKDAVTFLEKYYGKGADNLLKSLELVTSAQEDNIKTKPAWFWQGDGLTPGGLGTERYYMFLDNPEAPSGMKFIRQEVVSLKEYVNATLKGKDFLQAQAVRWQSEKRRTPVEVTTAMRKNASEAVDAALKAAALSSKKAPHLQEIVASAVIHQQLVERDIAFMESALAFFSSGGQYDGRYNTSQEMLHSGVDKKAECIAALNKQVYHDLLIAELCNKYMPRRRGVRHSEKAYDFTKRIAAIMGQKITLPTQANETELKKLVNIIETSTK
ncbi:hypothetical protein [Pseudopedobacter saltans]|nr:hypothetical protein [Pseudopedobacter saltans]